VRTRFLDHGWRGRGRIQRACAGFQLDRAGAVRVARFVCSASSAASARGGTSGSNAPTLSCVTAGRNGASGLICETRARRKPAPELEVTITPPKVTLAADDRRHPVGCAARRSGFARLALKIVDHGNRGEALTVAQTVRIDDRSCSLGTFGDCRDKDTAVTADQKIASAGSEPVIFDQRPIVSPNLE
jgi:hypothetical protein